MEQDVVHVSKPLSGVENCSSQYQELAQLASMQSLVKRHGPRRNDDNKRQLQTIGKINDKDNNYTPIYKTNKNVRKGVKNINRKMRNKIKIDRQTKNNS
jgi:hypothetical protein